MAMATGISQPASNSAELVQLVLLITTEAVNMMSKGELLIQRNSKVTASRGPLKWGSRQRWRLGPASQSAECPLPTAQPYKLGFDGLSRIRFVGLHAPR